VKLDLLRSGPLFPAGPDTASAAPIRRDPMLEGSRRRSTVHDHRGRGFDHTRDVRGMLTGQPLESFSGLV
jgi:hypothetical protein